MRGPIRLPQLRVESIPRRLLPVFLVPVLAAFPMVMRSQQPPATNPAAKLFRIAGILTDSVSNEAISGATLTLAGGEPRHLIQAAVTDGLGHFALNPVSAGKYSLRASRRGYMSSNFDEHDQFSSAIVTGDGQDTEHIPFHLNPEAMVRGVVTDDQGEPVERAQVLLMRKTRNGGLNEHLERSISGETDDDGFFEFWNLMPGTYFLAVKATPWFALHPSLTGANAAATTEQREAIAALDVAYPVTYFDSTIVEEAATPIQIASGEHVEANVTLHAMPAVHLSMHMPERSAAGQGFIAPPMLRQTILGEEEFSSYSGIKPGPPGSGLVEMSGVAPGHYSLTHGDPPRISEIDASGNQEIDVASGVPSVVVDIQVKMADGTPPPQPLDLVLLSTASVQRRIDSQMQNKSNVRFDSVPPGRWNLLAHSKDLALAVVSIQSGAEVKADSRILVKDRPLTLNVVLVQGKTRIEGFAVKDGKGQAGEMVVLVPSDPAASLAQFRRDQSDSDGSFVLYDVTPGAYKIVAIEDGWSLDWARPEVIKPYVQGGTAVNVTASSGALMQLSTAVSVQMR